MPSIEEEPDGVRKNGKLIGLAWLTGALILAFLVVGGTPRLARRIPMRWERGLARLYGAPFADDDICGAASPAAAAADTAAAALARLVARVYPQTPEEKDLGITVRLVRREQVNAVASLGGQIFIFSGLLEQARSAEEVAGVLAHEIEHVQRRHIIQSLVSQAFLSVLIQSVFGGSNGPEVLRQLLALKFSSQQEEDADRGAVARLKKGEVSRKGLKDFFERLSRKEGAQTFALFSDHPGTAERVALLSQAADYVSRPVLSAAEWRQLKTICGDAKR